MSKTSRCLGRSLVRRLCYRSAICLAASTFYLSSFGYSPDDLTPQQLRIYTFNSLVSLNEYDASYTTFTFYSSEFDALSVYGSRTFGLVFNENDQLNIPSRGSSFTNSVSSPVTPLRCAWSNTTSRVQVSPCIWPSVRRLFDLCIGLYNSGYRGPGAVAVNTKHSPLAVNFNFPVLVSDILSSTNTIYRQQLLSHLSQMNSLIVNIDSNVSSLSPQVGQIRDVNSSILSLLTVAHSNSVDNSFAISSNILSLARFVNTNPFVSDFTNSVNALVETNGDFPQGKVDYLLDTYASLDPFTRSVFALQVSDEFHNLNFMDTFSSKFNGDDFNSSVVDALVGDYPDEDSKRGSKASNSVRTSIKSQLQSWRNEAKQQLNDWKADLKQDLQDWKTSDATGYLNIKNSIDDNFSYTDRGSTNRLSYTSFVTNYVTRTVTNSIQQSSADIQTNATANTDRHIESDSNRWDEFKDLVTGDGDGLNVRIKFPLWEQNPEYHVMVHDDTLLPVVTTLSDDLKGLVDVVDGGAWHVELDGLPADLLDFLGVITNYYVDYNSTTPAADIAQGFLSNGFDFQSYSALPWFERVEVLLAMIANIDSTNSVEVADIRESMEEQVSDFQSLSTNIVSVSSDVVGLFQYVQRFSYSLQSIFGDRAAPLTGDYVLLAPGHWIGNEPLVLRVNPNIQNLCRLIMQCVWYLGFLVLLWLVVNWCWQKVVAVLRWLWSMFDV